MWYNEIMRYIEDNNGNKTSVPDDQYYYMSLISEFSTYFSTLLYRIGQYEKNKERIMLYPKSVEGKKEIHFFYTYRTGKAYIVFEKFPEINEHIVLFNDSFEAFMEDDPILNINETILARYRIFTKFVETAREIFSNIYVKTGYVKCKKCKRVFLSDGCDLCDDCKEVIEIKDSVGYVYIIEAVNMGFYKIGMTVNFIQREKNLVLLPFDIKLFHKIESNDYIKLERELHKKYADKRVNGEWFRLSQEDLEEIRGM